MIEESRLFLGENDHSTGPVGKAFEQFEPPWSVTTGEPVAT
jgi:hypothetical protein